MLRNRLYTLGNVAQGFFDQWEASTRGHRENMLYPSHRCGAAAIFGDGSVFYGTQLFARSCRVSTDSPAMPGTTPLSSSSQDTEGSPSAKPSPDAFEILSEILDNEKVSSTPEYSQFSAVSQDFVSEPPIEVSGENEESGDAVVGNLYEPQPFTALDESPSGEHHAGNSLEPSQTVTPQPSTKPALLPSLGPSQELLHSAEVAFSLPGETQASTTDYSEIAFSTVPTFDEKSISYVSTSAEEEVDTEPSSTPYSQDEPFETAELSTDMDMSSPPIIFSIPVEPSQINPFLLIGMVSSRPSEDSFVQKPFLASGPMEISEEFLSASAAVEVDASESPVVTAIVPPNFSHNPSVSDGAEVAQTSFGTSDAESAVGIISVNPTITPEISIRASIQPSRTPSPDPVAILLPEIANPSEQDDGLLESSGLHDTEALLYLLRSEEPGEELETTLSPSSVYTIKTPVPSPTATATEISREEAALIAKARRLSQLLDGLDRVLSVCISRLGTGSALCGIVVREVQSTGNMIAECEKRIEQVHEAEEAQL